jgi:hypothetical protein
MRTIIFFVLFLLFVQGVSALGVAVVPDHLVFDGDEEVFRIINPNNESIVFEVRGNFVDCQPAQGELGAQDSVIITCGAVEGASGESLILVETMQKNGDSVGVLPAVAVKAEIVGDDAFVEKKNNQQKTIKDKASPLMIDDSVQEADIVGREKVDSEEADGEEAEEEETGVVRQWTEGIMQDMKTEMITIALLTLAILCVLGYSWIKEKEKKDTISRAGLNKDPQQEQGLNTHQDSCPPLCGSPSGTSMHSQKNMSGSSGSPQNSPRRQEQA